MPDLPRDPVHDYRPGPASERPLAENEPVLAVFVADARRYWTDHAAMAAIGVAAILAILPWMGKAHQIPLAVAAVVLGLGLRGLYFRSEVFARRWQLTDRRLIGPQGRQVMLLEIHTLRRLFGDVQIVTNGGAKHLIKHLADAEATLRRIEAARAARAQVAR